jgi:hypothetical protein
MSAAVSIAEPDRLAIAPLEELQTKFGFTPEPVVGIARQRLVAANAG